MIQSLLIDNYNAIDHILRIDSDHGHATSTIFKNNASEN